MSGVNKVILVGNIGNIETKNNVTRASLATSEKYTNKQGEAVESTQWHKVVFFGKLSDIAAQYLDKGSKIFVEGPIKYSKYTGNDGIERNNTDIVVRNLQMLSSKPKGAKPDDDYAKAKSTQGTRRATADEIAAHEDFQDDEIPF